MKKLTIILLFIPNLIFGQGLNFDLESYNQIPLVNFADNPKVATRSLDSKLPSKKDLSIHTPEIIKQYGETCVSVSTLYYAAGTRLAYLSNITDKEYISNNFALSPLYNLQKLNLSCETPVRLDYILNDLLQNGGVSYKDYPHLICNEPYIDKTPQIKAIGEQRLCGEYIDENGNKKSVSCNDYPVIYNIKKVISNGYPVVAGIYMDDLYQYNPKNNKLYSPSKVQLTSRKGHAVTIVGYENDIFKVANSWGSEWGDSGYFYISEESLQEILLGAIVFNLDLSNIQMTPNSNNKGLGVSLDLVNLKNQKEPIYYKGNGIYVASKNYEVGDAFFGIMKNLSPDMYLTILSQDEDSKVVEKHYPREFENTFGSDVVDLLIAKDSEVKFPHPDYPLIIEDGNKDYLIILASKNNLSSDLPQIMRNFQNSPFKNAPIEDRLNAALKGRMILPSDIEYSKNEIKGNLINFNTVSDVLPIIVEINHY